MRFVCLERAFTFFHAKFFPGSRLDSSPLCVFADVFDTPYPRAELFSCHLPHALSRAAESLELEMIYLGGST